ncbi:MAG: hypothetical protein KC657_30290 [Myxococcales bacterium]|nr:hypothetical protein [Myxococcales bacterium]
MMPESLHVVVKTPHDVVLDARVRSARVPTETGQVGLRPRGETRVLVVEPGLIVLTGERVRLAATAGGLLEQDPERVVLYTPFAVVGDAESEVLSALDSAIATPGGELETRRRLAELEQNILHELGHRAAAGRGGGDRG